MVNIRTGKASRVTKTILLFNKSSLRASVIVSLSPEKHSVDRKAHLVKEAFAWVSRHHFTC